VSKTKTINELPMDEGSMVTRNERTQYHTKTTSECLGTFGPNTTSVTNANKK